jgi:P-type Cu+ transporter
MTTDPVCGMKVDESSAEHQTKHAGKKYFFCSEECNNEFEKPPQDFLKSCAAA